MTSEVSPVDYPVEWEADVLLSTGSTAHLRPIRPDDAGMLVEFYARVSPESKYLRFFAPYPVLSAADVQRFTQVDHLDRVALILTVGANMVAVGRYDRIDETDAEVAFLVEDTQQGKGVAQLLLEHLAEAARERGISRFVAEVLPQNRRMVTVFADAGYTVARDYEDGVINVEFPIHPTETSREVMLRREHRAEATSVRRLLHPERIALVGPADRVRRALGSVRGGGFTGEIVAAATDGGVIETGDPETGDPEAGELEASAVVVLDSLADLPTTLDVAITLVEPDELPGLLDAVAGKAFGMYLLHAGAFGGQGNTAVIGRARALGVRVLGPDALGIINTAPAISLNASPSPMPRPGVVGVFCQASSVGVLLLAGAIQDNLGLASFISSGFYADVTNNDVMQYWLDDDATQVCLLSLDRIGNPRKFGRIVRQLAMRKPVVLFAPREGQPERHFGSPPAARHAPPAALDSLFQQSGVIVCQRRRTMFDVAQILARQPLPAGNRVRVITNSETLGGHLTRFGAGVGLDCSEPVILRGDAEPEEYAAAARAALDEDSIDSVVVAVTDFWGVLVEPTHGVLQAAAAETGKPLLGVFIDFSGVPPRDPGTAPDGMGLLPVFVGYADALQALSLVTRYALWKTRDHGEVIELPEAAARADALVREILAETPHGRTLTQPELTELLAAYGIELVGRSPVRTLAEAIDRAEELGWNVVLKATADGVRGASDLGTTVFRHVNSRGEMADAWADLGQLVQELGLVDPEDPEPQLVAAPVVQSMVVPGTALELRTLEDPGFGPTVGVGLSGIASELLADVRYGVPPLTSTDAERMVRDLRSADALTGASAHRPVDVAAVGDLLQRLAHLADDLPQVAELVLAPCLAGPAGVTVLGARALVAPKSDYREDLARSLT